MRTETLLAAIKEAERFIKIAKAVPIVRGRYEADDWHVKQGSRKVGDIKEPYYETGKASGAAIRASMDLTRKLADLRQGR